MSGAEKSKKLTPSMTPAGGSIPQVPGAALSTLLVSFRIPEVHPPPLTCDSQKDRRLMTSHCFIYHFVRGDYKQSHVSFWESGTDNTLELTNC